MDQLLNRFLLHANAMNQTMGQPRFGIVTSYNPATHSAKVIVQPQGDTPITSGWLPICTPHLGNGWGIVAAPEIGEQVVIIPDSGDANHGIILGSVFSNPSKPPKPDGTNNVQSGEMALVHKSGSYLKLNNDGSVDIVSHTDMRVHAAGNMTLTADGGTTTINSAAVTVNGAITATGNITAGQGGGDRVALQTHRHGTGNAAAGTVAPTPGT